MCGSLFWKFFFLKYVSHVLLNICSFAILDTVTVHISFLSLLFFFAENMLLCLFCLLFTTHVDVFTLLQVVNILDAGIFVAVHSSIVWTRSMCTMYIHVWIIYCQLFCVHSQGAILQALLFLMRKYLFTGYLFCVKFEWSYIFCYFLISTLLGTQILAPVCPVRDASNTRYCMWGLKHPVLYSYDIWILTVFSLEHTFELF